MVAARKSPDRTEALWALLEGVPDPEIPVLSVVDLGIVRDISELPDGSVSVTITPTYTGCPATEVIERQIREALESGAGVPFAIRTQISPAWTTNWISEKGKRALEEYGIAPPEAGETAIPCPRCGETDVECISQFGSTPCKALYKCRSCLEPFDHFKCI
jgi:ring-1,2-phenylacetyl-CoA epoxidase subunit PaaD